MKYEKTNEDLTKTIDTDEEIRLVQKIPQKYEVNWIYLKHLVEIDRIGYLKLVEIDKMGYYYFM